MNTKLISLLSLSLLWMCPWTHSTHCIHAIGIIVYLCSSCMSLCMCVCVCGGVCHYGQTMHTYRQNSRTVQVKIRNVIFWILYCTVLNQHSYSALERECLNSRLIATLLLKSRLVGWPLQQSGTHQLVLLCVAENLLTKETTSLRTFRSCLSTLHVTLARLKSTDSFFFYTKPYVTASHLIGYALCMCVYVCTLTLAGALLKPSMGSSLQRACPCKPDICVYALEGMLVSETDDMCICMG